MSAPVRGNPTASLRILEFSRGLYPQRVGGREIFVADLITSLAERGNEVVVLSETKRDWPKQRILQLAVLSPDIPVLGALLFGCSALLSAARHSDSFDVIHTHSPRLNVILGALIARVLSKAHVITVHCSTTDDALRDVGTSCAYAGASFIVAVSAAIVQAIHAQLGPLQHVVVIPSSSRGTATVEVSVTPKQPGRTNGGGVVIIYLGRISNHKRPDLIVEAFEQIGRAYAERNNVRCVFVGEGPDQTTLAQKIAQSPLRDRISLLGGIHHEDVMNVLSKSDIFVLPSRHEGLGMAVVEAMRASLPVVVADSEGLRDMVEDGVTGLIFPVDDAGALSARLRNLIENPSLRGQLGRQASKRAAEAYDFDSIVTRHEELYEAAIRDHAKPEDKAREPPMDSL